MIKEKKQFCHFVNLKSYTSRTEQSDFDPIKCNVKKNLFHFFLNQIHFDDTTTFFEKIRI